MRIFIGILVFDIVFRSMSVLYPWDEWADELDVAAWPAGRLPTRAEMTKLGEKADPEAFDPVAEESFQGLDALWDYLRPWPGKSIRAKLLTAEDWGKWSLVWLSSRLQFAESVIGFDQRWPMFSPSVSTRKWLVRSRLTYADGSERIVRQHADPEDLTCYAHWNQEKILDHELQVREKPSHVSECRGYCNLLAHRYATNAAGSPLVKISLFDLYYLYPGPDDDPEVFLREQSGPPAEQIRPVFYVYDVATRQGWRVAAP